jgi:FkbM family methyltransferase
MHTDGFYFVVDTRDEDVAMRVALNSAYEPVVGALFLAYMKECDVVVDAGANKGYYTYLAAKKVGPEGRVIAYEPEPRNLVDLQRGVRENRFANVDVVGKATASKAGKTYFTNTGWNEHNSAWGKMVKDATPDSVEVETCSLDDELERFGISRVDVLKMDIQGGELEAVPGLVRTLDARKVGTLLMELHDMQLSADECHSIVDLIHSKGYEGRAYNQSDFTDTDAIRFLRGGAALALDTTGTPSKSYSHSERFRTPGYKKPLQFVFRPQQ